MNWWAWSLGFCAGAVLASWLTLSCAVGHTQSPEVSAAIHQAATTYGVSEAWMRRVSWCESRWTPWATNARSGAAGLFQFMPRTWRWMSAQAGWAGASPYDPWAAAAVAAWGLRNGYASHWSCS
jgi:soluble lytic murein transglycosylase-like protein